MNKEITKSINKIEINNIPLTEKLEVGRYSSDDMSILNKVLNVLDHVAFNFDVSENGYSVNSTVGIAPKKAIIFNTRLSDNNMNVIRNFDDYVEGNIGNNFAKYPSVMGSNKDLDFIKEGTSINRTLIINRGIQVYLAKAKGSKKDKLITLIHFLYELKIGANSSLLNEVKPNVNGALNLKDTEKAFLTKGFIIDSKIERHNRRGYLPSITKVKSSVVKEVYSMYEKIYEYFQKELDELLSDSKLIIAEIHDENAKGNKPPKPKTQKGYMVQISDKKWQYMTTEKIESIEQTKPTLTKITKSEFMQRIENDTMFTISKKLNEPKQSKVKTVNPNTVEVNDSVKAIIDASNKKQKMENGQSIIKTNSKNKKVTKKAKENESIHQDSFFTIPKKVTK